MSNNQVSNDADVKVSVLMCVYNGERYLETAINSVIDNGYTDFELIVVNDGSTDNTSEILSNLSRQYSQIRIINKKNSGLTNSLNIGLLECRGKYIARLDADDLCIPGRFIKQIECLEKNPQVGLVGSNAILIDENGYEFGKTSIRQANGQEYVDQLEKMEAFFPHSSWMMRKQVVEQLGGYDDFYHKAQDYEFLLRCSEYCEIACLSECLVMLRKTESSVSYDSEFMQYKYAMVARLMHFSRVSPVINSVWSNQQVMAAVEEWFYELGLGKKLLAQQYLMLAKNNLRSGQVINFLRKIFSAFKIDPMFIVNLPMLNRIRAKPHEDLISRLT